MKKIMVTGGAGFIGSHLCERLINQGHRVICIDNYFTGSTTNIENLIKHPNFEILTHNICSPLYMTVDEIYNLACPASPWHYQRDPIYTMKTNIIGSYNLLELAKRTGAKILQASTSEVYGDPNTSPQSEEYWGNVNPVGIRSCYDEGKRAAETLFTDYNRMHGVRTKIVRIFNTYGPKMSKSDGRVVSNFVVQALKGDNITVYGDGQQTRSFCYVDDLVDGLISMMATEDNITGPINLGNPNEFTILELVQKVLVATGSKSQIIKLPLPQDDPKQRKPDITKAIKYLNWTPSIELDIGLRKTIDYFSKNGF
jgi:UDP-glucuronate decarboxylase